MWTTCTVDSDAESLRLEALGLTHISQEAVSLRQLAGSEQIEPLHTLASVLEPVTFHDRAHMQHPNQLTPLNQLVDAIPPDPPSRHNLALLVSAYLQDPRNPIAGRNRTHYQLQSLDRGRARNPAS
jgi:hexosaminidase